MPTQTGKISFMLKSVQGVLLALLIGSLVSTGLKASGVDLNTLLTHSPFGQQASNEPVNQDAQPLEFRGTFTENGTAYFSVYETATSRSAWVQLNEDLSLDYIAKAYDRQNRQLTLEYQGQELILPLAKNIRQNFSQTTAASATPASPPPSTRTTPSVSEAQRLANIAAEIKRRRALRQEAINRTKQSQ